MREIQVDHFQVCLTQKNLYVCIHKSQRLLLGEHAAVSPSVSSNITGNIHHSLKKDIYKLYPTPNSKYYKFILEQIY